MELSKGIIKADLIMAKQDLEKYIGMCEEWIEQIKQINEKVSVRI